MTHSFSAESAALQKAKVQANLDRAAADQDLHDADTFARTIGQLLATSNKACRKVDEVQEEVAAALTDASSRAARTPTSLLRNRVGHRTAAELLSGAQGVSKALQRKGDPAPAPPPPSPGTLEVSCHGTAPFCDGACPSGWSQSHRADGGQQWVEGESVDCSYDCWTGSKAVCYIRHAHELAAAQARAMQEAIDQAAAEAAALLKAEEEAAAKAHAEAEAAQALIEQAKAEEEEAKAAMEKAAAEEAAAKEAAAEAQRQADEQAAQAAAEEAARKEAEEQAALAKAAA